MLRDRGSIKWVSMMLPEHVELLREYHESFQKIKKPILDEQKYEEFNEIICEAMAENRFLQFAYYRQGEVKTLAGRIHYADALKRELRIVSQADEICILKIEDIIEIEYDCRL
ncbi:YolD-like family protein [Bacillus licheniformis]|uniref:YolD-like family protein n=1 Tax=Bacillus licheniformis TaxID=1402 RepID=UPI00092BA397|nr:YolD-like family protein [Bacillus licheniformis]MCM3210143.1 YolD-like family protein [Bacillus licheniformis]MCM3285749.1 YolD-like family protein [Bacillus licheniformis]MCY9268953.1 YolD-like family protein [Bacillus licheniformis]MEC0793495.1 YolD-like family protein [Bacillus licheniformis]MED4302946.1 YolD-like family protein [Bacillus licheniformis]